MSTKSLKELIEKVKVFFGAEPARKKDVLKANEPRVYFNDSSGLPGTRRLTWDKTFCPRTGAHYDDVHDFDR